MTEPTRGRYTLLNFALALSVITYVDRVAIASAATAVRAELGLSPVEMGWVFSAFTFAYAAFEIPSGWWGDVVGPRRVLARIVVWWSAFTMATGAAWNLGSLLVARFLFGVGEAGAFPNISRSFARWFPDRERGHAHGVVFMGTRLGGAIAPPLVVMLMAAIGWRLSFVVCGFLGLIWCIFWLRWFRDDPAQHPSVNEAELSVIRGGLDAGERPRLPWSALLSTNLLLICMMYFCMAYTLYFNLTWLPTYLKESRGFSVSLAGWISGGILLTGALGSFLGGRLTDHLVKTRGLRVGRRVGMITLPIAGALLVAAAQIDNPVVASLLLAATLGVADLNVSSCWSMCHDVGGESAGTVSGAMNTFGNIGGAISPLVVGYAVQGWNSWTVPFYVTAGVYVMGGFLTFLIDPTKKLSESAASIGR
jgi:ACS family glucarate transporter-like MFS transporter